MHKVASFRMSQKGLIPVLCKEVDSPAAFNDLYGEPREMGKMSFFTSRYDWRQFSNSKWFLCICNIQLKCRG